MLGWLSSKLSKNQLTHCLGTESALDAFVADLQLKTPQHALAALDDWFEEPERLFKELPLAAATRALCRLDESLQDTIDACAQAYLIAERSDHTQQAALRRLDRHFRQMAAAYIVALQRMIVPEKSGKTTNRNDQAILALRAMRNLVCRQKCIRFAYQAPDETWWKTTHALLFLARDHALLHSRLSAYPRQEASCVWQEYLSGLIFETAPLSSLTPVQMDALYAIAHWAAPHFICVDRFSPRTPFCIRLDENRRPQRCMVEQDGAPAARYFGPGSAYAHLARLRTLVSAGKAPGWLTGFCEKNELFDLLLRLTAEWSPTPPKRSTKRLQVKGELRVTAGFALARRMIAASEFARSGRSLEYDSHLKNAHRLRCEEVPLLEPGSNAPPRTPLETLNLLETAGDRQMTDTWDIIDRSPEGLGARFVFSRHWQRLGALVAYRQVDEIDWRIGILRRLGRSHGAPNAGLQLFEGIPHCAQVQGRQSEASGAWQQQTRATSGHGLTDAIQLSAEKRLLLLPKGCFSPLRPLDLLLGGRRSVIRLIELQISGEDYDLVTYEPLDAPS